MTFIAKGVSSAATDQTGRTTDSKVEVAERINENNEIVELTTHKATQEVSETFVANSGNISNTAVAGQVAASGASVVVSHQLTEKVDGYPEVSITKRVVVAAATTTTTTGA